MSSKSSRDRSPARGSSSSPSDSDTLYRLYSNRLKRTLGKPAKKSRGKISFKLKKKKPYFPRIGGCDFVDFNEGDTLYLEVRETANGEESWRRCSKSDLTNFELREMPWELEEESSEEIDHYADPDEDADYKPEEDSVARFIDKLTSETVEVEDAAWRFTMVADRKHAAIALRRIVITPPSRGKK